MPYLDGKIMFAFQLVFFDSNNLHDGAIRKKSSDRKQKFRTKSHQSLLGNIKKETITRIVKNLEYKAKNSSLINKKKKNNNKICGCE